MYYFPTPPVLRAGVVDHTGNSYPDSSISSEQIPTRSFRQTPRRRRQGNGHTIAPFQPCEEEWRLWTVLKSLLCGTTQEFIHYSEQTIINSSARITRWTDRNVDSSDCLQHWGEYTVDINQWIPRWRCGEDQCSPRLHVLWFDLTSSSEGQ